jgi:uncharacterized protein
MNKVQSIRFQGPAGQIEGLLKFRDNETPKALAVVCHPHPLFQGTMHNKVVFAIAEAFFRLGCEVLRFNFRGVGLSEGVHDAANGEVDDALAAVDMLRERHPGHACHVAGFSFGAGIAVRAAHRDARLASLTAVAPSFKHAEPIFLSELAIPKLFLQGTADDICPADQLRLHYETFAPPKRVVWFQEAGHFFNRQLDALKDAIIANRQFLGV